MPRALLHTNGLLSYGFDNSSAWHIIQHQHHISVGISCFKISISKADDNTAVHILLDNPSKLSGIS